MKKLISLVLVLIMSLSFVLPASAADDALTEEQIKSAVNAVAGALIDADEDATVKSNSNLIDAVTSNADTPEEIANFFSKFIFVEESEVEAISQRIADSCTYRVTTIENGKKTVYVAVDLRTCKEIFDARVFLNATKKLLDKCEEKAIEHGMNANPDEYDLMTYNHLAGELALHMIITDWTNDFGATHGNLLLEKWYNMSVVADLNIDENRLAPALISAFGNFVKTFLSLIAK